MADEQEAIAPVALEAPASEPAVETKEVPREIKDVPVHQDEPTVDEGEADSTPEFITVERNGKTFQVPKELEGEFSMQADYTKKTQTVAERAKELDAREAAITQQSKVSEAELDARATIRGVDQQLKAYENVDWVKFAAEDPAGAQQHRYFYDGLKEAKLAASKTISENEQRRTQESQQATAKRFEEAKAYAQTKIPGWSEETNTKLMNFVKDQNIPMDFVRDNMSPTLVSILHKAWLGDQALKRQAAAPKAIPEPIEPLQTVSAKSAPAVRVSLADLAKAGRMEEYAAARKAGRTR